MTENLADVRFGVIPSDTRLTASELSEAIAEANIPTLIPLLVQMTGDLRWIEDPYRPNRPKGVDDNDDGGLSPEIQAEIRNAAVEAITEWQNGRPAAIPEPPQELLQRMFSAAMGEPIPDAYGPWVGAEWGLSQHGNEEREVAVPDGFEVLIIGAGASGLGLGVQLDRAGIPFTILERNDDIGGTWYEERYPGCGVDTPSHLYSYSFYTYDWPDYFSRRDTLFEYFRSLATHFDLWRRIQLGVEVTSTVFREETQDWEVVARMPSGKEQTFHASVVVSAVGTFARPVFPRNIEGLETFDGPVCHTARWPDDVEYAGKRVAVVGNGASAMQLVPAIVDDVESLVIFQRSPQWAGPFAKFHVPVPEPLRRLMRAVPLYLKWYRLRLFWTWNDKLHSSLQVDPDWPHKDRAVNGINDRHREGFVEYIKSELGDRLDLLDEVVPTYPVFGKRILLDNGWFRTLTRENVTLESTGLAHVSGSKVTAASGACHEVDVLIFATGFDVVRYLAPMEIVGRSGTTVRTQWDDDDAKAYLGSTVPDLPNFFMIYGPNTQPGHGGSLLNTLECQIRYVVSMLKLMFEHDIGVVEVKQDVYEDYAARVDEAHRNMIWTHPGMTTYARNARGRVVSTSPWRNVDFWSLTRIPNLDEYEREPATARRAHRHASVSASLTTID